MKKVDKVLQDIDKVLNNWDERSSFKLKGVGNLSKADLSVIELYANQYLETGGFHGLMQPMGHVKEVLDKYGIQDNVAYSLFG